MRQPTSSEQLSTALSGCSFCGVLATDDDVVADHVGDYVANLQPNGSEPMSKHIKTAVSVVRDLLAYVNKIDFVYMANLRQFPATRLRTHAPSLAQ